MKVIFLDIDGVLNTSSFIGHFWTYCQLNDLKRPETKKEFNELLRDEYGNIFDPLAVTWLRDIIERTDAKIVISSSWRSSGLSVMQEMWKVRGLPGEVIDITPFPKDVLAYEKANYYESIGRGAEVQMWLDTHKSLESYCIIDDDSDMLSDQVFVQTNEDYGITEEIAERVIRLLNKEGLL